MGLAPAVIVHSSAVAATGATCAVRKVMIMLKDWRIAMCAGGELRPGMSLADFRRECPSAELVDSRGGVETFALGKCVLDYGREFTGFVAFNGSTLGYVTLHDPEIEALGGWVALDDKDVVARVKARNDEYVRSLFGSTDAHPAWGHVESLIHSRDVEPIIIVGYRPVS